MQKLAYNCEKYDIAFPSPQRQRQLREMDCHEMHDNLMEERAGHCYGSHIEYPQQNLCGRKMDGDLGESGPFSTRTSDIPNERHTLHGLRRARGVYNMLV